MKVDISFEPRETNFKRICTETKFNTGWLESNCTWHDKEFKHSEITPPQTIKSFKIQMVYSWWL